MKDLYSKLFKHHILRALVFGIVILAVMFAFDDIKYDGLSTWMISAGLRSEVSFFDLIKKFIMTVLSLGVGFQGSEITPLFDIGLPSEDLSVKSRILSRPCLLL